MMTEPPAIQQISLSLSTERVAIAPATAASHARQLRDLETVRTSILEQNGGPLTFYMDERYSPFSVAITPRFSAHVRNLHKLLDKALVDVVSRWYTDKEANLPSRMPLEKHEDDLLRWISGLGKNLVPGFDGHYGMWRTDFLIERGPDGAEQAKVCEINSRIPFNAFWGVGMHEVATQLFGAKESGFESPNDFEGGDPLAKMHCH